MAVSAGPNGRVPMAIAQESRAVEGRPVSTSIRTRPSLPNPAVVGNGRDRSSGSRLSETRQPVAQYIERGQSNVGGSYFRPTRMNVPPRPSPQERRA